MNKNRTALAFFFTLVDTYVAATRYVSTSFHKKNTHRIIPSHFLMNLPNDLYLFLVILLSISYDYLVHKYVLTYMGTTLHTWFSKEGWKSYWVSEWGCMKMWNESEQFHDVKKLRNTTKCEKRNTANGTSSLNQIILIACLLSFLWW